MLATNVRQVQPRRDSGARRSTATAAMPERRQATCTPERVVSLMAAPPVEKIAAAVMTPRRARACSVMVSKGRIPRWTTERGSPDRRRQQPLSTRIDHDGRRIAGDVLEDDRGVPTGHIGAADIAVEREAEPRQGPRPPPLLLHLAHGEGEPLGACVVRLG